MIYSNCLSCRREYQKNQTDSSTSYCSKECVKTQKTCEVCNQQFYINNGEEWKTECSRICWESLCEFIPCHRCGKVFRRKKSGDGRILCRVGCGFTACKNCGNLTTNGKKWCNKECKKTLIKNVKTSYTLHVIN